MSNPPQCRIRSTAVGCTVNSAHVTREPQRQDSRMATLTLPAHESIPFCPLVCARRLASPMRMHISRPVCPHRRPLSLFKPRRLTRSLRKLPRGLSGRKRRKAQGTAFNLALSSLGRRHAYEVAAVTRPRRVAPFDRRPAVQRHCATMQNALYSLSAESFHRSSGWPGLHDSSGHYWRRQVGCAPANIK